MFFKLKRVTIDCLPQVIMLSYMKTNNLYDMKNLLLLLLALVAPFFLMAQCNPYYEIREGMVMETTNYNSKDKQEGKQVTTIKSFEENSSGWVASMNVEAYDKKDKLIYSQDDVEIRCEDGTIKIDMDRFIPQESLEAFKEMDMEINMDDLELPDNLEVGQQLDGGTFTMSGSLPMKMETTITNRKVDSKETITTPAGTFDCFVITYDMVMKMGVKRTMMNKEWIAKDVGVVKSATYKSNGKMLSYSLLTNVK